MLVIAVVLFAALPFGAMASLESWKKAVAEYAKVDADYLKAKADSEQKGDQWQAKVRALRLAEEEFAKVNAAYRDVTGRLKQAEKDLAKAQNAKTKDTKEINRLTTLVRNLQNEAGPKTQANTVASGSVASAKAAEKSAGAEFNAAKKIMYKLENNRLYWDRTMYAERPWYIVVKEGATDVKESFKEGLPIVGGAIKDGLVKVGNNLYDWATMGKIEKAANAAAKALPLMKNPPEKLIAAFKTVGEHFGTLNNGKVVFVDIVGCLVVLVDAATKYQYATTSAQKIDAIANITEATLNTLEKGMGLSGGIISNFANVGNQFCTALVKAVANVTKLIKEHYDWDDLVADAGNDWDCNGMQGYSEIALNMYCAKKTEAQTRKVIEALKVIRNAN